MADQPHIVLIHGLWYGHWFTMPMARKLKRRGYQVSFFRYPTVAKGIDDNAADLIRFIDELTPKAEHIVAHSLGGLVTMTALSTRPDLVPGRVVFLGSPLNGSKVARTIRHWPGGRWMLGEAADPLTQGIDAPPTLEGMPSIGMIAGVMRFGLGLFAGAAAAEGDGTVELIETRMPGLADHVTVSTSHTGLLLSSDVANQADHFLREGRFSPAKE